PTLAVCFGARSAAPASLIRWALFALAAFMFWGIGWSPQYELYLVPFVLLAFRPPVVGLVAALLLEGLTLLEYPVLLPWAYYYGGSPVWLAWAAVVGRYCLLAWVCWLVVREEVDVPRLLHRMFFRPPKTSVALLACIMASACTPASPSPPSTLAPA